MFSSLFGRQGDKGDKGDTGDAGVQGEQGIQGEQGVQGDAGIFNYTDRGDVGAYDYQIGVLTLNGVWQDMNLASIVGAGTRLVLLRVMIDVTVAERKLEFRTKGYTGVYNQRILYSQVGGIKNEQDIWILTDASGVMQYNGQSATWTTINIVVRGWCAL